VLPKPEVLWEPISTDGLPPELVDAFERKDWPRVRDLVGTATRGVYGRQVLQFRKRFPLGIDPILSQHRGWASFSDGDWDDLERCLAVELVDRGELSGLRDIALAPLDPVTDTAVSAAADAYVLGSWACDLNGMIGRYRRLMARMLGWRSDLLAYERGVAPALHVRHALLQGRFFLALLEGSGGRLDVAETLAREATELGDEHDVLRILAADLLGGISAARGGRTDWPLRYPAHIATPRGSSAIDVAIFLLRLAPFLALRRDDTLARSAELAEAIAVRIGSPRLLLQAQSWRAAAAGGDRAARVAALLVKARRTGPGLRALPLLLRAIDLRNGAGFAEAEHEARRAGALWIQVAALTWAAALDPDPVLSRRLARLLNASGWRRGSLVPSEIASDAALGLASTGVRSAAAIELALAAGRPNVTYEIARRYLDDIRTTTAAQRAAIDALATIGTTHARELLHRVARRSDAAGRAATEHLARSHPTTLSERETEVLDLAGHGMTNKEIAEKLSLSPHTVARHLANARSKLGAANRTEAVAKLGERT
jgi:DNA-binding CsgD family transcriptional regulator